MRTILEDSARVQRLCANRHPRFTTHKLPVGRSHGIRRSHRSSTMDRLTLAAAAQDRGQALICPPTHQPQVRGSLEISGVHINVATKV